MNSFVCVANQKFSATNSSLSNACRDSSVAGNETRFWGGTFYFWKAESAISDSAIFCRSHFRDFVNLIAGRFLDAGSQIAFRRSSWPNKSISGQIKFCVQKSTGTTTICRAQYYNNYYYNYYKKTWARQMVVVPVCFWTLRNRESLQVGVWTTKRGTSSWMKRTPKEPGWSKNEPKRKCDLRESRSKLWKLSVFAHRVRQPVSRWQRTSH